jgi:restriction system protein
VIVGWPEIGDLKQYETRRELQAAVRRAYRRRSGAVIANWTGQLWRFQQIMHIGDLVVMPLRHQSDQIAIGRIAGPYTYRPDAAPDRRHTHPVKWIRVDQPRSTIQQDLLYSLGSLLTVCELRRNAAAYRLERLAATGVDPGPSGGDGDSEDVELNTPDELIARTVANEDGLSMTVRELLAAWSVKRRTGQAVSAIEQDLAEHGLITIPSITEGWLDSRIRIVRSGADADDTADATPMEKVVEAEQEALGIDSEPALDDDLVAEKPFTLRFGHLLRSDGGLTSVKPGDSIKRAQTLMLRHNYSQLAVIDEDGTLHGAVSWESIAHTTMRSTVPESVADVRRGAIEAGYDDKVLPRLDDIAKHGFVFVRSRDRKSTVGIVTSADLTQRFGEIVRPFSMIEECERRLKRRARVVFADDEIKTATKGRYRTVESLTLGAYSHVIEEEANFLKLDWRLDHHEFRSQVDRVAKIRNKMMHFSPDPLPTDEWSDIDGLLAMLQTVDPVI